MTSVEFVATGLAGDMLVERSGDDASVQVAVETRRGYVRRAAVGGEAYTIVICAVFEANGAAPFGRLILLRH